MDMPILLKTLALSVLGCAAANTATHYPQTATVGNQATAAETTVVHEVLGRSFGKEWTRYVKSSGHAPTFTVGHADLNGDAQPDLLVSLNDGRFGYCGSGGCAGYAILATPQGYAHKAIELAYFFEKTVVLRGAHKGMHDLLYDDARKVFVWDGTRYR